MGRTELKAQSIVEIVDELSSTPVANPQLLDPAATPENLKMHGLGIGIPMPTRQCTRETTLALRSLALPMFGMPQFYSPDSLEVGEARNQIVEHALRDGVERLLFIDYDVAPPSQALVKLLSLNVPIAAGVYNSKQVPSNPLIMVEGYGKGYDDYRRGDLIKAQGVGMGCCLIHMDVFRKIKPPWFKTVRGYVPQNPFQPLPHMTEDIYFCQKAMEAGYDIIVDTQVQCGHVDWKTGMIYMGIEHPEDPKRIIPAWIYRHENGNYVSEFLAEANHPGMRVKAPLVPTISSDNPGLDLGCGQMVMAGYLGVDLNSKGPNIRNHDISDLRWYREEFGYAPKIRASHSLEHISHRHVAFAFRDWFNTLEPGGLMEVWVPDGEASIRRLAALIDEGKDDSFEENYIEQTLYGWQIGEGQEHKCLFTKKRLESLAISTGFEEFSVESQPIPSPDGTAVGLASLYLRAVKPGGAELEVEVSTNGHDDSVVFEEVE